MSWDSRSSKWTRWWMKPTARPRNSNYILNACMTGIAMRRLGLTQEHYLSPLSSEHGQNNY